MDQGFTLYELLSHGIIGSQRFTELNRAKKPKEELHFFLYLFTTLGTLSLLFGAIFFVAANWNNIPSYGKLIGAQSILALNLYLAYYFKEKLIWFRLMLFSSSVLVGVNLAVIGQVYQTGADSFLLFALWTFLITPWAWCFRAPYLLLFWNLLLLLSLGLFYEQYLDPFDILSAEDFNLIMLVITNFLFLISVIYKKHPLFTNFILPYFFQIMASSSVLIGFFYEFVLHDYQTHHFILIFLLQSAILLLFYYRQKRITHFGFALLSFLIGIEIIIGKTTILESIDSLTFAFLTVLVTYGFALTLIKLQKAFRSSGDE